MGNSEWPRISVLADHARGNGWSMMLLYLVDGNSVPGLRQG